MSRPITSEILDRTDLKSSEKLVLVAIASHGTNAFPSQHRLAKLTSLSLRTIKATVKGLRTRGIIATTHSRKTLTYSVVIESATIAPMVQPLHLDGATIALPMVQPLHPNSKGNSKDNSPLSDSCNVRRQTGRAPRERVVPF